MQQAAAMPVCFTDEFVSLMRKANVRWTWVLDTVVHPEERERSPAAGEVYVARHIAEAENRRLFVVYKEQSGGAVPIRLYFRDD